MKDERWKMTDGRWKIGWAIDRIDSIHRFIDRDGVDLQLVPRSFISLHLTSISPRHSLCLLLVLKGKEEEETRNWKSRHQVHATSCDLREVHPRSLPDIVFCYKPLIWPSQIGFPPRIQFALCWNGKDNLHGPRPGAREASSDSFHLRCARSLNVTLGTRNCAEFISIVCYIDKVEDDDAPLALRGPLPWRPKSSSPWEQANSHQSFLDEENQNSDGMNRKLRFDLILIILHLYCTWHKKLDVVPADAHQSFVPEEENQTHDDIKSEFDFILKFRRSRIKFSEESYPPDIKKSKNRRPPLGGRAEHHHILFLANQWFLSIFFIPRIFNYIGQLYSFILFKRKYAASMAVAFGRQRSVIYIRKKNWDHKKIWKESWNGRWSYGIGKLRNWRTGNWKLETKELDD